MHKIFINIFPVIVLWGIFAYVVLNVSYPESLVSANWQKILLFFTPLFFAVLFTINIFAKNFLVSSSLSLGLIFLLILKALDSLNIVTGILVLIATWFLVSYFAKIKRRNLTKLPKIPKLTRLRKEAMKK